MTQIWSDPAKAQRLRRDLLKLAEAQSAIGQCTAILGTKKSRRLRDEISESVKDVLQQLYSLEVGNEGN